MSEKLVQRIRTVYYTFKVGYILKAIIGKVVVCEAVGFNIVTSCHLQACGWAWTCSLIQQYVNCIIQIFFFNTGAMQDVFTHIFTIYTYVILFIILHTYMILYWKGVSQLYHLSSLSNSTRIINKRELHFSINGMKYWGLIHLA